MPVTKPTALPDRFSATMILAGLLAGLSLFFPGHLQASTDAHLTGREILKEVYRRHEQFPYVYEEQVMIMIDRAGRRNTRKLRRFSRIDSKDLARYMLLFDAPPEVHGVGLLTSRRSTGESETAIYLPAYGPQLISSIAQQQTGNFLGTDFSVNDLLPEVLDDFSYDRQEDEYLGNIKYLVVDVYPKEEHSVHLLRRHFIREDSFYITRTDIFDRHGRLHKQLTHHDLKFLGGALWRSNMIRMVDHKLKHQSLIKIEKRVFSRDYVPDNLFTLKWLVDNHGMQEEEPPADTENKLEDKPDNSKTENNNITMNSPGDS